MPARRDTDPDDKRPGGNTPDEENTEHPIVGIGTSAGGLAALKTFLEAVPANSGMAYVIIQHLDPRHESLTAQLLDPHTDMPVRQAEEGTPVEVDHVYVIPPNAYLTMRDDRLSLSEPVLERGVRMPIDHFFRSLAEARQQAAIGILLTGTGSDGTQGVKAIKGNGGMAMAQDPETAQFDGMVRSAIAAGLVDYVLPVERMPEALIEFARHAPHLASDAAPLASDDHGLEAILQVLGELGHHDFNCYKKGSLLRRIARRMALLHMQNMGEYAAYLRDHPDETGQLFQDLLISVTGFFRDPDHFNALEQQVLRRLIDDQPKREPLRIWVAGCASGEEAYTLGMICLDLMRKQNKTLPLQIFATDINTQALDVARAGTYPEAIAGDISPERLEHYFTRTDSGFQVSRELRSYITFAEQNLVADPPYSRLDLISCRNLLIYLQPELQRKLLALFHFALREGGYLFLGGSETVSAGAELFTPVDKQARIYRRIPAPRRRLMDLPLGMAKRQKDSPRLPTTPRGSEDGGYEPLIHRRLLSDFTPAAVLVDDQRRIRYSHGPIEHYLRRPPGVPTDDLFAQAREGLHTKLRTALRQASREGKRVTVHSSRVRDDRGELRRIRMSVEPVTPADTQEELLLVVFEDAPEPTIEIPTDPSAGSLQDTLLRELEQELKTAREEQQRGIEELESSNEELKSANEEVLSMNEELQSANEELETAKEELQSMNEELSTVKTELEAKVAELRSANDDMRNLLAGTEIAMLFLDRQGRIKLFTPATRDLFNIVPADVGRPLTDIAHKMRDRNLTDDAQNVLRHLTPLEAEVETVDGRWFVERVRPYRTEEDRIGGVVATFVDITERKRAEQTDRQLATVVRDSNDAIITLDLDGRILTWNRGAERMYDWNEQEVVGRSVLDLMPADRHAEAQDLIQRIEQGRALPSFETQRTAKDGRVLDIWLTATAIAEDGKVRAITTTERDISERKQTEQELQAARDAAERFSAQKTVFLASASHDLRQPLQTLRLLNTALAMQLQDDGRLEIVAQQGENLKAMKELLDSLLDVTRLDLGQVKPRTTTFAARTLYRSVHDHFGEQARRKGLTLHTRPSDIRIRSDRHLLKSILYNLVSNAITHTERGKVLIGCRRRGSELRIEVWDTGPGIPEEELDTIFAEFHQLKNPARQRSLGLGLGLAITNRLADILGHRLEVRSTPGRGSMFAIVVPIATAAESQSPNDDQDTGPDDPGVRDDADLAAPGEQHHALTTNPHRIKVLLIEDDPGVANALGMLGEVLGFDWRWASQGDDALRLQQEQAFDPDVLISDFRLPGGRTGLEVIRALRDASRRDIPAILLTGDVTSVQAEQVKEAGCSLMHKPVDGGALAERIRSLTATAPTSDGE